MRNVGAMSRAIVFSAGVAWHIGVLRGIADEDADLAESLRAAGTVHVGTSAGAVVASQFAGGVPLDELFALRFAEDAGLSPDLDLARVADAASTALAGASSAAQLRDRLAGLVRSGFAADRVDRRAVFARDLPVSTWPDADLRITAVDVATEHVRVFDRRSGVPLVDAVAASCAVPLVWPPVEIEGRRYVDGGVHSALHLDVARDAGRMLVLAAGGGVVPARSGSAAVMAIAADAAAQRARGTNSLAVATQSASSEAGRRQGRAAAAAVRDFWNGAEHPRER